MNENIKMFTCAKRFSFPFECSFNLRIFIVVWHHRMLIFQRYINAILSHTFVIHIQFILLQSFLTVHLMCLFVFSTSFNSLENHVFFCNLHLCILQWIPKWFFFLLVFTICVFIPFVHYKHSINSLWVFINKLFLLCAEQDAK